MHDLASNNIVEGSETEDTSLLQCFATVSKLFRS